MRAQPFIALVLLVALPLQSARAYLWDSDTLATEVAGKGKILDIIVGRFPRNPPVYYEVRLARVSEEMAETPDNPELYDDAGVACDHLHRSAEAISWMEKKAVVLGQHPDKDQQYRYHANLGTFLIHQWLSEGADPTESEGARGAEHIRKAIEINPDAHFGREVIQLRVIDWILEERTRANNEGEAEEQVGPESLFGRVTDSGRQVDEAIEGLTGMIAFGAAWESVDVFTTLADCLAENNDASIAYLAELRVEQLEMDGKKSLVNRDQGRYDHGLGKTGHLVEWFVQARTAADAWQSARTTFIEEQIAAGKHPDTHPDFWNGFDDSDYPLPKLPRDRPDGSGSYLSAIEWFRTGLIALLVLVVGLIVVRLLRRA